MPFTRGADRPLPNPLLSISPDIFTATLADDPKPAFPLFSSLPVELRCKIWYHALPAGRVLEIRTPFIAPPFAHTYYSTNEPNPVLLQVNYEARRECLRHYTPLFSSSRPPVGLPADETDRYASAPNPLPPPNVNAAALLSRLRFIPRLTQESNIYIDCRRDALYFDRSTSVTRLDTSGVHVLARFLPLLTPYARQHISHIALDANLLITYISSLRKQATKLLRATLPNLRGIALVELADGLDYDRVTNYRQHEHDARRSRRCERLLAMRIELLDIAIEGRDEEEYEHVFGHMWFPADWSRLAWMHEWYRMVRRENAGRQVEDEAQEGNGDVEDDGDSTSDSESDLDLDHDVSLLGDEFADDEDRVEQLGLAGGSGSERDKGDGWGYGLVGVPIVKTLVMRRGGEVFLMET